MSLLLASHRVRFANSETLHRSRLSILFIPAVEARRVGIALVLRAMTSRGDIDSFGLERLLCFAASCAETLVCLEFACSRKPYECARDVAPRRDAAGIASFLLRGILLPAVKIPRDFCLPVAL